MQFTSLYRHSTQRQLKLKVYYQKVHVPLYWHQSYINIQQLGYLSIFHEQQCTYSYKQKLTNFSTLEPNGLIVYCHDNEMKTYIQTRGIYIPTYLNFYLQEFRMLIIFFAGIQDVNYFFCKNSGCQLFSNETLELIFF